MHACISSRAALSRPLIVCTPPRSSSVHVLQFLERACARATCSCAFYTFEMYTIGVYNSILNLKPTDRPTNLYTHVVYICICACMYSVLNPFFNSQPLDFTSVGLKREIPSKYTGFSNDSSRFRLIYYSRYPRDEAICQTCWNYCNNFLNIYIA